jgi:ubiquinone/menaquinone biosynthesis C-methylase UbiE
MIRRIPPLVLVVSLLASGCGRTEKPTGERPAAASAAAAAPPATSVVHDPAHPPIDCPLRKHGIDPAHMRPFDDVEKYIAFLERADRAAWQKPDEVVAALGLRGTETVFDLGAGSGYFSFRFAKVLASGKVVAADTEAEMIRHVHHKAMSEGVGNVEAKLIQPADPGVSPDADLVFVCDVLHHVADRPAWLAKLAGGMKSGSRLALIEFKEGNLPEGPPEAAKIPRAQLVDQVGKAGFTLERDHKDLLPYQVFLVFRKP